MKKLFFILLLLTSPAFAQNLIDQEMRDNTGNRPWLKTITETAGDGRTLHIPVVSFSGSIATTPNIQLGTGPVTATTQRVTLATDGPGITNLTTIANNTTGGATAGASLVSSTAYESSRVIKASAGTLISIVGYNSAAAAQFIQVYNSATVPANAAVPIYTFSVAATSNFSLDVPLTGAPFTTGISVSNSSTGPTKTSGGNDCFFTAVIK